MEHATMLSILTILVRMIQTLKRMVGRRLSLRSLYITSAGAEEEFISGTTAMNKGIATVPDEINDRSVFKVPLKQILPNTPHENIEGIQKEIALTLLSYLGSPYLPGRLLLMLNNNDVFYAVNFYG